MENAALLFRTADLSGAISVGKETKMNRRELSIFIFMIMSALILRLCFITVPGYRNEVTNYKIWSQSAAIFGVHNIYDKTWCNIPPANAYLFKGIGYIHKAIVPSNNKETSLFQFLVKIPPILADILISILIFIFVRKKNTFKVSLLAASAYAFNPAVIISSAYWGQMDPVATLIALGAVICLVNDMCAWAWALLALALLTNIHLGILIPIFALITWKREGLASAIRGAVSGWGVFFIVLLPFIIFHQIDRIIDRLFYWTSGYPYISFVAFNFWWPFRGGDGNWMLDTDRFLNIVSYRTFSIILLGVLFLLLLRYLYLRYKDDNAVIFTSFLSIFFYFIVSTQMYARNVMPSLVFLVLLAVNDKNMRVVYSVLSSAAFMNLLLALYWAYPKDFPVLPAFFRPIPIDLIIVAINCALFCYFLYLITKGIRSKYMAYFGIVILMLLAASYIPWPPRQVYLSDLTPKIKYQQTGEIKFNDNFIGYFLSVNGYKFSKGIGTQGYSSIEYGLGGRYRFLEGMVGNDDTGKRSNKIEAWIYADNKLIYKSGTIQGAINPLYFYIDIKGAKVIKLVISDGGDGIDGDSGDWLNIKAIP
jgi:Gpi18-like mannosyltransferase